MYKKRQKTYQTTPNPNVGALRAEFCRHFIETGEIDGPMQAALQRYAEANREEHLRNDPDYLKKVDDNRAAANVTRRQNWRAFNAHMGLTSLRKDAKFIGPRLPTWWLSAKMKEWKRETRNATRCPDAIPAVVATSEHELA